MNKGFQEVDTNLLEIAEWNYKTEDEELTEKLKNNIKLNGQIENIIVYLLPTSFYSICNGNHRYDVLKELGITKVMTFNLGKITESKAKRIAVETNETRFDTDNIKLAELIKEIGVDFSIEDLAETMPYDINELENFSKMLDFDWNQIDSKEEEIVPEFAEVIYGSDWLRCQDQDKTQDSAILSHSRSHLRDSRRSGRRRDGWQWESE